MKHRNICLALLTSSLLLASVAQAATVTGQVNSSLVLTSACMVNGASGTTGLNFGSLNFGTVTALFTQVNAQVIGGGGGAVSILCSSGVVPVLRVGAGSHDGQSSGGIRALADGAGNYIAYDLYADSGTSNVLAVDATITFPTSTGVAQTVNIYGKALGKAGLPIGRYTDTVAVELSF